MQACAVRVFDVKHSFNRYECTMHMAYAYLTYSVHLSFIPKVPYY